MVRSELITTINQAPRTITLREAMHGFMQVSSDE